MNYDKEQTYFCGHWHHRLSQDRQLPIPIGIKLVYFLLILGGLESNFWGHWYPCFELLVASHLDFKARVDSFGMQLISQNHLWCDTYRPLGGRYGNQVSSFQILSCKKIQWLGNIFDTTISYFHSWFTDLAEAFLFSIFKYFYFWCNERRLDDIGIDCWS